MNNKRGKKLRQRENVDNERCIPKTCKKENAMGLIWMTGED